MVLVDTSVWVDHLRAGNARLAGLLNIGQVLAHPFVIGELALGQLGNRAIIIATLQDLPQAAVATDPEVLHFIEHHSLFGLGIGYVDVHLLASVQLTSGGAVLWTRDQRLETAAGKLGIAMAAP